MEALGCELALTTMLWAPCGTLGLPDLWTFCGPFPSWFAHNCGQTWMSKHWLNTLFVLCIMLGAFTWENWKLLVIGHASGGGWLWTQVDLLTLCLVFFPVHLSCRLISPSGMVVEQVFKVFSFKGCQQSCICCWGEGGWMKKAWSLFIERIIMSLSCLGGSLAMWQ